jgi:hypothetical protein
MKLDFNAVLMLSTEIDNLVQTEFETRGETMDIVLSEQRTSC